MRGFLFPSDTNREFTTFYEKGKNNMQNLEKEKCGGVGDARVCV